MAMTITVKKEGDCKSCGETIAIGARATWYRGHGIYHVVCPNDTKVKGDSVRGARFYDESAYPGKCRFCELSIPKGSPIAWEGRGMVSHRACYDAIDDSGNVVIPETPTEAAPEPKKTRTRKPKVEA